LTVSRKDYVPTSIPLEQVGPTPEGLLFFFIYCEFSSHSLNESRKNDGTNDG
jgi:hypothetical protein